MMTLDELMQVKASGEPIEVFDTTKMEMYHPEKEKMLSEWNNYEVLSFYSLWNESSKETKTHVEVKCLSSKKN